MNKATIIGRLVRDTETRYSQGNEPMAISRYTLAVDRKFRRDGEQEADFINCVAFGKAGDFAEKYFRKGMKVAVSGRIQTGSYTHKDAGIKIPTFDIIVEEQEFAESKKDQEAPSTSNEGWMNVPDGIDSDLPF